MTRSLHRALVVLAVLGSGGGSDASAQNPAALMQERQANDAALREYTWKSRTEMTLKGEPRHLVLELVRFDLDGRLQKTPIGGQDEQEARPSAPLGRGGFIQQRVKARKRGQFEDLLQEITARAHAYTVLSQEQLGAFLQRGTMSPGAEPLAGTIRIDGRAILSTDDALSIWFDRATRAMRRLEVTTTLDDRLLHLSVDYRSLPNGLIYPARSIARYPDKELEIVVETFEYQHAGGAY